MRRLLLAVVPLLLVGCGSADRDPLRDASLKTTDAGSARLSWSVESEGERLTLEGAVDFRRRAGELGGTLEGIDSKPVTYRFRFADDGAMYVQYPLDWFGGPVGADMEELQKELAGKWLKLGEDEMFDFFPFVIPVPGARDPRDVVDLLKFAKGSIEIVGNEDVGGAATTHYRAKLDAARLADRASADENEEFLEVFRSIGELPLDAWIDEAGRARRVVLEFPAVQDDPAATITVEFADFGIAVDTRPPAPKELVDEDASTWHVDPDDEPEN